MRRHVLGDLQGPKIRIERFADGKVMLNEGEAFALDTCARTTAGTIDAVGVAYKNLPKDVRAGDTLLLNDGSIVLDVDGREPARASTTRVVIGGELSDQQGHQPAGRRHVGAGADRQGSRRHQARGASWASTTSPCRSRATAADMDEARELLRARRRPGAHLVAKIERSEAITNLDRDHRGVATRSWSRAATSASKWVTQS